MADPGRMLLDFLMALGKARTRWLLIGRQALIQYGAPMATMDHDLWADPSPDNLSKVRRVARKAGLETTDGSWAWEGRDLVTLVHQEALKIDLFLVRAFTNLDGISITFDDAYERKIVAEVRGDPLHIPLPSLEVLRILKRMRDTARDQEDLRYIDLLIRQRRRPGAGGR